MCTGNTCRSPTAEAIARREVEARGWSRLEVRSAGVSAFGFEPASPGASRAAARRGIDLASHRSSPVTVDVLEWADLVLTMSPGHLLRVTELGGGDKAELITAFASGESDSGMAAAVRDPFGGDDAEYDETFFVLRALVDQVLERLEPMLSR